jgi:hypothetical protein
MCEMRICTLDFETILMDNLRSSKRPIAQQGINTRGYGASRQGRSPGADPTMWWIMKL